MKKFFVQVLVGLFVFAATPTVSLAQVAGKRTAVFAGVGAGIGAWLSGDNRPKGAAIGGAAGVGASIVTEMIARAPRAPRAPRQELRASTAEPTKTSEVAQAEHRSARIASADDTPAVSMQGPTILIRHVQGANARQIKPASLTPGTAVGNYALLDEELARKRKTSPDYFLDVIVTSIGNTVNGGGVSFFRDILGIRTNGYGNASIRDMEFEVSVSMVDFKNGVVDPSRTATKVVRIRQSRSGNGYLTVASIRGFGNHRHYQTNPANAAAEEAIDYFFSVKP